MDEAFELDKRMLELKERRARVLSGEEEGDADALLDQINALIDQRSEPPPSKPHKFEVGQTHQPDPPPDDAAE